MRAPAALAEVSTINPPSPQSEPQEQASSLPVGAEPGERPQPSARELASAALKGFRRLGPAGPLALVAASSPVVSGFLLLASIPWVAPWLREHPGPGIVSYVAVYVVLGGLALMPTYAYSVLAGWAFHFAAGFPAAMAAYVGAALVGYGIGRRASGDRALEMVREHPKLQAVCDALIGCGFWRTLFIVTLLRLPPNSPFAMSNLAMAAMRVNPVAYVIGTAIGLSPRTAAVVFVASGLSQLTFEQPQNKWIWIGSIAVTLLVLGVIGYIANGALAKVSRGNGASEPPGVST